MKPPLLPPGAGRAWPCLVLSVGLWAAPGPSVSARATSLPPPPPLSDTAAARTALAALDAGRPADAYVALGPLLTPGRPLPPGSVRWSARLAQTRLLVRLGAPYAARTTLPAPPPTPAPAWAVAAWHLTRAELERAEGRPLNGLASARQAAALLRRLTPDDLPLRANAWVEMAAAYSVVGAVDSAFRYAVLAAADPLPHPTPAWATAPAARLALPPRPRLFGLTLLAHNLSLRGEATGPVTVLGHRYASAARAAEAVFDSAACLSRSPTADDSQRLSFWRVAGVHWSEKALNADDSDNSDAPDAATRALDALARAAVLAHTPAARAEVATTRGELLGGLRGPAAALPVCEAALLELVGQPSPSLGPDGLPTSFRAATEQDALLYLLELRAHAYRDLYAASHDPRHLDRYVGTATRLADVLATRRAHVRRGYATETPGLDAAVVADNYLLGLDATEARFARHHRPADLATAFRITQNAKAWRLLKRVGAERATAGLRPGDRELRRYERAAADLRRWEELHTLASTFAAVSVRGLPDLRAAPDSVAGARAALLAATARLRARHPRLYEQAFSGDFALTTTAAQAALPPDGHTAAIEFLRPPATALADDQPETAYAFVVQRTGTRLLRLTLPPRFAGLLDSLVVSLSRPGQSSYPQLAARAYAHLLAPVVRELPTSVRHLIVSPDGDLWRLPFEALLTRPLTAAEARAADYRVFPYAIKRWSFTYAHSLTLRSRAIERPAAAGAPAQLLALAPFSDSSHGATLPFSGRLLRNLQRGAGGAFLVGADASRGALRGGAAQVGVLHLATHATANLADPTASYLTLADGPMPLAELFGLPLRPRLVVLSACETGIGRHGGPSESALSLSWGFAYLGASTTVATLWRVDDAATAALLGRFYARLRRAAPRGTALHTAKIAGIDSARTAIEAAPFYWAGLVLTGDDRPLALAPAPAPTRAGLAPTWWWATGLAVLGGGAAWWWRNRRKRAA